MNSSFPTNIRTVEDFIKLKLRIQINFTLVTVVSKIEYLYF